MFRFKIMVILPNLKKATILYASYQISLEAYGDVIQATRKLRQEDLVLKVIVIYIARYLN